MERRPIIAVVDDKDAMRRLVGRVVGGAGWDVEEFASGDLFLQDRQLTRFSVVLLDLRMPGTGGLAVLNIMRERGSSPPVIVLTGHGGIAEAVEAMRIGASDFLQKPFANKDLVEAINTVLSQTSEGQETSALADAARAALKLLTPRQVQLLRGIVVGDANKVIAYRMDLSVRTVEAYRAAMLDRLGARNTAAAVRTAIAADLDCSPYLNDRAA